MSSTNHVIAKKGIMAGLRKLGLRSGDHVLAHSSLSSLGRVRGGADTVIDALLAVLGPGGTLVLPSFGGDDEVFDVATTGTALGAIPQSLLRRKGCLRSRHPLSSVAALGGKASFIVKDHDRAETAHGPGTPYYRLYELGGKVLLLGVDQDRSTFLHVAESMMHAPYLRSKDGAFIDASGKRQARSWRHFPGPHRNFIGMQKWLEESGLTAKCVIGSSVAQLMSCKDLLETLLNRLREEPDMFISKNPRLPDGIRQRADILRAQWRRASFVPVADSRFAGRYIEEIIDNLKRFGIEHVLLSFVNGVAWERVESRRRKWYLSGLRAAGLKVAAVGFCCKVPEQVPALLKEAGTDTLVVPSTCPLDQISRVAANGMKVLVENVAIDSERLTEMLEALPRRVADKVKLAFNPLGFLQAGESPFLRSYRTRIRHHIDLLYVNDGLPDGRRVQFERGQSEIKELVSILHCKSFRGILALQSPSSSAFPESVERFMRSLKEIGAWPEAS